MYTQSRIKEKGSRGDEVINLKENNGLGMQENLEGGNKRGRLYA